MLIPFLPADVPTIVVAAVFLYPMLYPKDQDIRMTCKVPEGSDNKHLNTTQVRDLLIQFGNCTEIAHHRQWSSHGGYVTLINATPYDWNLTSLRHNEMEYDFPGLIPAGRINVT